MSGHVSLHVVWPLNFRIYLVHGLKTGAAVHANVSTTWVRQSIYLNVFPVNSVNICTYSSICKLIWLALYLGCMLLAKCSKQLIWRWDSLMQSLYHDTELPAVMLLTHLQMAWLVFCWDTFECSRLDISMVDIWLLNFCQVFNDNLLWHYLRCIGIKN